MKRNTSQSIKSFLTPLALTLLLLFSGCSHTEEAGIDLYSRLQDVSRLELARMTVGKVGMISDPDFSSASGLEGKAGAIINSMKIGTRIGVYSYDTYLVAFIDLNRMRPEDITIDKENATAVVKLPPVEVMVEGRDPQLREEHLRVTGLRSKITPAERAALKAKMSAEVSKEIDSGTEAVAALKESAKTKARIWFAELLSNWGYQAQIIL